MNLELLEKQYEKLNDSISKEEKNFIYECLTNKEDISDELKLYYGEILEEKKELEENN